MNRWPSISVGWTRVLLTLLGATAMLVIVTAAPAQAHSGLVSSDPADRAVLAEPPQVATLTFTESVRPVVASFQLFDPAGGTRQLEVAAVDRLVEVRLPAGLVDGSYLLGWRVISADSHPISGALSFSVGQPSASPARAADPGPAADRRVSWAYLVAQVAAYLGLFAAVGLTLFQVVVLRSVEVDRARDRVLVVAVAVTVVGHALLLPLTLLRGQGLTLDRLADPDVLWSTLDSAPAVALALAVLGGSALLLQPVLPGIRAPRVVPGLGAVLAVASVLPVGHTRTTVPTALVMTADLVHAFAGALWFGGVIGLAMFLTAARRGGRPAGPAALVVRRFSGLAGGLVLVLGATGVVLAVLILGSVTALVDTDYGRTLLVKLGFVAVIGLLALWNKAYLVPAVQRRSSPREQWRRLTGAVRDEVALLAAVLCLTGLLVMQSPVGAPTGDPPASGSADLRIALGTGTVQGRLVPARVGVNQLDFTLRQADGEILAPLEPPDVTADLPEQGLGPLVASVRTLDGGGRHRAELTLPAAGRWDVVVSVRVDEFTSLTARQVVVVGS